MKLYIAGPMTGRPQFNFPAFFEAAERLRAEGFDVTSPAELDDPETRKAALSSKDGAPGSGAANGETWADFLARDVKLIGDEIEGVAVLDGWEGSRGARLETFCARLTGLPVFLYSPHDEGVDLLETDDTYLNAALGYGDPGVNGDGGEIRVTNDHTGGQKGRKPQRMELLPWAALMEVAELYHEGAKKYDPWNWRKGLDWSLCFGAMQRHAALFWEGEDSDSETGCHHLTSVVFHALALLTFIQEHPDLDDRPGRVAA